MNLIQIFKILSDIRITLTYYMIFANGYPLQFEIVYVNVFNFLAVFKMHLYIQIFLYYTHFLNSPIYLNHNLFDNLSSTLYKISFRFKYVLCEKNTQLA